MTATQMNDFSLEGLKTKLETVDAKLDELLEQKRWQREVADEFSPILREMMDVGTERLQAFDEAGYFGVGREALRVLQRVFESYSEDDVRQLGDQIVGILDTARNLTQPSMLSMANDAADAVQTSESLAPVGMLGAMRATRDADVQKGTAVMLEILRRIGRASAERPESSAPPRRALARVADATAPGATDPEAKAAPPSVEAAPAASPPIERASSREAKAGWELCEHGHLADADAWTERFAEVMAGTLGHPSLSEAQWAVIRAARAEWTEAGAAPNIRRLGAVAGVPTRELYQLFPKAPARTVAKIAGLPKPAGCL